VLFIDEQSNDVSNKFRDGPRPRKLFADLVREIWWSVLVETGMCVEAAVSLGCEDVCFSPRAARKVHGRRVKRVHQ